MYQLRNGMIAGRGALDAAAAVGGAFTGIGDIAAAYIYGGLRAYNAAYATALGPCIDICDAAGANTQTINVTAAGDVNLASIATWVGSFGSTIKVTKLYDQTGNSRHFANTTVAKMPTLILSALNGKPVMNFPSGSTHWLKTPVAGATTTVNQPCTFSVVARRTGNFGGLNVICNSWGSTTGFFYSSSASKAMLFAGSGFGEVTVSDSTWHVLQAVLTGASSTIKVDGAAPAATSTDPGSSNVTSSSELGIGDDNNENRTLTGDIAEIFIRTGADNSTVQSNTQANQAAYWGL